MARRKDVDGKRSDDSLGEYTDIVYSFLWNNPFNLYSFTREPTQESVVMQLAWQAPPVAGYVVATAMGAETIGFVGFYSVASMLGVPLVATAWLFGAVTAAAIVDDVLTVPVK